MLNLHSNNNDKKKTVTKKKKNMRPAEREPTLQGFEVHCATHYPTDSGVNN